MPINTTIEDNSGMLSNIVQHCEYIEYCLDSFVMSFGSLKMIFGYVVNYIVLHSVVYLPDDRAQW